MTVSQPQKAWHWALLSIVTLLSFILILYQQTSFYLISLWNQLNAGEYGHGYLVLAISAYLIFYNREKLSVLMPCPKYTAMPAVFIAVMFWTVAALVDVAVLQAVGLLLLVLTIMWALLGTQVSRVLFFPVAFISFAIPVWFPLSPLLQEVAADVVFWMIRILDVPAYRIENMIVLPSGRLSIEEACSGLRYFLAALTLGTLYAYLNYSRLSVRLVVVLTFAGTAVLANILRVFIVVYLAYTSEMQHPLVYDHLNLGWYLFAGLVLFLLVIEILLLRAGVGAGGADKTLDSVSNAQVEKIKSPLKFLPAVLLLMLITSIGPLSIYWLSSQSQGDQKQLQVTPVAGIGEWSVIAIGEDEWTPQYRGAHENKITFSDDHGEIYLYLGLYFAQRQGEELINDLNKISDNKVWRIIYRATKLYNVDGRQVYEKVLEKNDGSQRLVWYWYRVAGQDVVNKYQAKFLQVLGLLTGERRAAIVAIASELDSNPEHTRNRLRQFAVEMGGEIESMVDGEM